MSRRYGPELFEFPTLATSKRGRDFYYLKISTDLHRVWVTKRGLVVEEVKAKTQWLTSAEYHVADAAAVPDLFRFQGCRFCQGADPSPPPEWRFCPHCGGAIQRRPPRRRRPT